MTEGLDKRLHEALAGGHPPAARSETIKKEALRMFDQKMKIVRIYTWVGIVFSCVLMIGGLFMMFCNGNNPRGLAAGALLFASGLAMQVLMKLWYWVVHSRLIIQKDLADLKAQVAELAARTDKPAP
jgi:hypothetical protein